MVEKPIRESAKRASKSWKDSAAPWGRGRRRKWLLSRPTISRRGLVSRFLLRRIVPGAASKIEEADDLRRFTFADGRPNVAAPPRHAAVRAGPPHPRAVTPLGDVQVPQRQRAFDNLRDPPLQKPRVVTAHGHAGAADIRAAVRAGPPSAAQQCRELHERHKRENRVIRKVLRLARAARRRAWRPPVVHACPTSSPRPREGGARMLASGRSERGPPGDDGGGDGDGPPGRSRIDVGGAS